MKTILLSAAALAAVTIAGAGHAATFSGEFFESDSEVLTLADADAIIADGPADATFLSETINFPTTGNTTASANTLSDFLGGAASTLSGLGDALVETSVFRFTGFVDLAAGDQMFTVGSDDGFRLTIGGVEVASNVDTRSFRETNATADSGSGPTAIELIYFENVGNAGVRFSIDGALAAAADAPAPIPLPAGLPLLAAGLCFLGVMRRKG